MGGTHNKGFQLYCFSASVVPMLNQRCFPQADACPLHEAESRSGQQSPNSRGGARARKSESSFGTPLPSHCTPKQAQLSLLATSRAGSVCPSTFVRRLKTRPDRSVELYRPWLSIKPYSLCRRRNHFSVVAHRFFCDDPSLDLSVFLRETRSTEGVVKDQMKMRFPHRSGRSSRRPRFSMITERPGVG